MNDQIRRQKLIEERNAVAERFETLARALRTGNYYDECCDVDEFITEDDIAVAIEALSQPPADQWIPCDIAVPAEPVGEYYKDVQIKKRSGEVVIGYYRNDDGEWWEIKGDDADRMLDAVEWRPLPEAYKGE